MNELFFIYNGKFYPRGQPVISAGSRALVYGDGLFETMRWSAGNISLQRFHYERLFEGMNLMCMQKPALLTPSFFNEQIEEVVAKNHHVEHARIRLMVFREEGALVETQNAPVSWLIESFPMPDFAAPAEHFSLDVFSGVVKSADAYSHLKTNNYLPGIMTANFAKNSGLDDALVLNAEGRVCETSIANVFVLKDNKMMTPPLTEGCVAGVMRRWLLEKFDAPNYQICEEEFTVDELMAADEIFVTNAIKLLQPVSVFRGKPFGTSESKALFARVLVQLPDSTSG